jgi:hypothetical protein
LTPRPILHSSRPTWVMSVENRNSDKCLRTDVGSAASLPQIMGAASHHRQAQACATNSLSTSDAFITHCLLS